MAEQIAGVPTRHCFDRLGKAVLELKAQRVLETGTNIGLSTREFDKALKQTGGRLWSVDINPPMQNWHLSRPCSNTVFVQHDALTLDVARLGIKEHELDILLLDDAHNYRHLLQELRKYAPYVKVGGRIFVDDPTHCDGVMSPEAACGLPVLWATALWCREVQAEFTLHTEDSLGLLEIPVTKPLKTDIPLDQRIFGITGVASIVDSQMFLKDTVG